jgi:RND family efflux transporter MFP subunit
MELSMRVGEDDTVEQRTIMQDLGPRSAPTKPPSARRRWLIAVAVFAVVALVVIAGVLPRVRARSTLKTETARLAVPTVSVIQPKRAAPSQEIVLPANVQPYITAPIYARTNGYLKRWYADIGVHVKKGQLLADIETPEVDQQLQQAKANLATAEANLSLAQITANRYQDLLKSDSVSKQETDNAVGAFAANRAVVQADQANVKQLEALQSFEKIYAPFDGVITARNTDIGALISAGNGGGGTTTELFHIAQPDKLRAYVNVPEAYSLGAKPGLSAELSLAEYPGKLFPGKLVRTADAIDPTTRTLLVEIDVDNPTGSLLSGAYAEMHLKLPGATSFTVPVNTLMFRSEGLRVAAVTDGKHADLKPITIGHDFGSEVEVIAGLNGNESIIINPPDSLVAGEEVRIAQAQTGPGAMGAEQK